MPTPPVHWHEGLFLRPHHFQAAERYFQDQNRRDHRFDVHYNWGLRVIEIDVDALKNYRFVVNRLEARTREGTLIVLGPDQMVPELNLRPLMESASVEWLEIMLAVPLLQVGKENTSRSPEARFKVDPSTEPTPDENSGSNARQVQFRRLNLLLKTRTDKDGENVAGLETIPIARIRRSSQAGAPPQLDADYIPPLLACDAWKPLAQDIINAVYHRIGSVAQQSAQTVRDQRINFDSNAMDERVMFERLRAMNETYSVLHIFANAQGIHPLSAYLELVRAAGKLAVFSDQSTLPDDLPAYDHDDLGKCFYWVKRFIDTLLSRVQQSYKTRLFVGKGLRMGVTLDPAWLAPAAQMFVGVTSQLTRAECADLLTSGKLNMKIGAAERVDEAFMKGLRGLDFVPVRVPPTILPGNKNITYLQINRDSSKDEWAAIGRTYNLAIRLNEKLLVGQIDGLSELSLSVNGRKVTLLFTLYVIPPG